MKAISGNCIIPATVLDNMVKARFGDLSPGVSGTEPPIRATIFLQPSANNGDVSAAEGMLTANTLSLAATKTTINADGVDSATITYPTADPNADYVVYLDHWLYARGLDTASGGLISLVLSTDTPGTYTVWISRRFGDFACGHIVIEAV